MSNAASPSFAPTLLFVALLAAPGRAAQTSQRGPPIDQLYPGPLGMADFGKIVSGEFTGDLKRDAVVMDGVRPKLLFAPETYDTAITVCPSANDIATLSGVLPGKDLLLTVGIEGLRSFERDSANGQWIVTTIRDAASAWGGATRVAVGQLDGTGAPDVAGMAADGRTVLTALGNPDGTYTDGAAFDIYGQGATDLWCLNWRDDGPPVVRDEIAVNSPAGIELYDAAGTFLEGINWTYSPIVGAVTHDGGTVERLALVTRVAGIDRFSVYGDAGTEPWFSLGAAGVVSVAAGDADGDGDTEVFLSITRENGFWELENLSPAAATFGPAAILKHPFGPPGRNPAYNHAGLAPGDFDSDGALDVLAPAQGDPGPAVAVYGSVDLVSVGSIVVGDWRPGLNKVFYLPDTHELELRFTRPPTILQAESGAVVRIGVKVFHTEALGIGTDPDLYHSGFLAIPAQHTYAPFRIPLPPGYSLEESTDLLSFVARQTVLLTGAVLDVAPALTGIYSADPNVPVLRSAPNTLQYLPTTHGPSSSPTFGGMSIGPTVPSMDEDDEPEDEDPD